MITKRSTGKVPLGGKVVSDYPVGKDDQPPLSGGGKEKGPAFQSWKAGPDSNQFTRRKVFERLGEPVRVLSRVDSDD